MTVFGWRCLIWLEESLISVLVFEICNLQEKKYFLTAFCIAVDRIINCSARSAIVMCLPLSLAQSKTITPALSDQLSFPFDPNNFVSWLFLLVFTIVCLFVFWYSLFVGRACPSNYPSVVHANNLSWSRGSQEHILMKDNLQFALYCICNRICISFCVSNNLDLLGAKSILPTINIWKLMRAICNS